jgi:hypothetical protein
VPLFPFVCLSVSSVASICSSVGLRLDLVDVSRQFIREIINVHYLTNSATNQPLQFSECLIEEMSTLICDLLELFVKWQADQSLLSTKISLFPQRIQTKVSSRKASHSHSLPSIQSLMRHSQRDVSVTDSRFSCLLLEETIIFLLLEVGLLAQGTSDRLHLYSVLDALRECIPFNELRVRWFQVPDAIQQWLKGQVESIMIDSLIQDQTPSLLRHVLSLAQSYLRDGTLYNAMTHGLSVQDFSVDLWSKRQHLVEVCRFACFIRSCDFWSCFERSCMDHIMQTAKVNRAGGTCLFSLMRVCGFAFILLAQNLGLPQKRCAKFLISLLGSQNSEIRDMLQSDVKVRIAYHGL